MQYKSNINYKKVSENESSVEEVSAKDKDNSIFSEQDKTIISPKATRRQLRTQLVLKYIKENPGTSAYEISKELSISYTDVGRLIRDLIYVDAIVIKQDILKGRARNLLFVPEVKK